MDYIIFEFQGCDIPSVNCVLSGNNVILSKATLN